MTDKETVHQEQTQRTVVVLRALADWLEQHPQAGVSLPGMWSKRMYQMFIPRDPQELAEKVKAIGTCRKQPCANQPKDFEFVVDLLPDFELVFWTTRDKVCTPKVVGQKLIPEERVPEKITPEHYEDIVEWDCAESVLAPSVDDEVADLNELANVDVQVEGPPLRDENTVSPDQERQIRQWAESMKEYKD